MNDGPKLKQILLLLGIALLAAAPGLAKGYPLSDHYDGKKFFNPGNIGQKSFGDFIKAVKEREKTPWPQWVENENTDKPPLQNKISQIRLTYVNHASVLIQTHGLNFLTDPIWSERCSPVSFAGPKRHRAPGIHFDDLPAIHVIVISHNHYDHLDLPTLHRIEQRDRPLILAGLGTKSFLDKEGFKNVVELDWWQKHPYQEDTAIHFVPAQHWSKRNFFGRDGMLWGGFVFQTPSTKIFFAGDTGYGPHFQEIQQRFGKLDAALLPIGAYKPQWFMKNFHMGPKDAIRAFEDLGSPPPLPFITVHFPWAQKAFMMLAATLKH
ncbi:MAG: hypothetical protein CMH56_10495 [Myxococcales bacterium]|nr:hypothetical protein [Myxococcales bacterium]